MNSRRNACLSILTTLLIGFFLASCGKKTSEGAAEEPPDTYAYQAEWRELESGLIIDGEILDDTVYYISTGTAYGAGEALYRLAEKGAEKIPLEEMSNGKGIYAVCSDLQGNLKLLLLSQEDTANIELRTVSPDGKRLLSWNITSAYTDNLKPKIMGMVTDNKGNTLIADSSYIHVFDKEGALLTRIRSNVEIHDIAKTVNGEIAVISSSPEGMQLHPIDTGTWKIGPSYSKSLIETGTAGRMVKGILDHFLYYYGDEIYSCNVGNQRTEAIASFMENNIEYSSVRKVLRKQNGDIIVFLTEFKISPNGLLSVKQTQAVLLKRVAASEIPSKEVITYGTWAASPDLMSDIVVFNKNNNKYHIELKEYAGDSYDMKLGMDKLQMDFLAGNGPDIIDLSSGISFEMLVEKGLLEDLSPRLAEDADIKEKDFLENVLSIYRKDGGLYGITSSFFITTLFCKESLLPDVESWTLKDLTEFAQRHADAEELFTGDITREKMLLEICLPAGMNRFVNWDTGECCFDSEEFINLLEFCNKYGCLEEDYYGSWYANVPEDLQSEKKLLIDALIGSVYDLQKYREAFGEPIKAIGYPAEEGNGSFVHPCDAFGINASSTESKKEGAWQFIKTFLLPEYQEREQIYDVFPVRKDALEKICRSAMIPEYERTETEVATEKPKRTFNMWGLEIQCYAAAQQDIDTLNNMIANISGMKKNDIQIEKIAGEESAAYFAGQKTAKEAAEIIQSRVQTYVYENK